jgi:hypothetical protein
MPPNRISQTTKNGKAVFLCGNEEESSNPLVTAQKKKPPAHLYLKNIYTAIIEFIFFQ